MGCALPCPHGPIPAAGRRSEEGAAFRRYPPLDRTLAHTAAGDAQDAVRTPVEQAAELGLANAILAWRQRTGAAFHRFARAGIGNCIGGECFGRLLVPRDRLPDMDDTARPRPGRSTVASGRRGVVRRRPGAAGCRIGWGFLWAPVLWCAIAGLVVSRPRRSVPACRNSGWEELIRPVAELSRYPSVSRMSFISARVRSLPLASAAITFYRSGGITPEGVAEKSFQQPPLVVLIVTQKRIRAPDGRPLAGAFHSFRRELPGYSARGTNALGQFRTIWCFLPIWANGHPPSRCYSW